MNQLTNFTLHTQEQKNAVDTVYGKDAHKQVIDNILNLQK